MGEQPHLVVVPFPVQGHVMPMMNLSQRLADQGFMITFVNSEFIHGRIMDSLPEKQQAHDGRTSEFGGGQIRLVFVPDGLTPEQQKDEVMLQEAITKNFPGHFERLLRSINSTISCVISDTFISSALQVARKIGIPGIAFFPAAAALTALSHSIPKLVQNGIIDDNGTPKKTETFMLSPTMPAMSTAHLLWYCNIRDPNFQEIIFQGMIMCSQILSIADWVLCNSFYELEPGAFSLVPNLLPLGPLSLAGSDHHHNHLGSIWQEDSTCLSWLDQQATNAVIYVSFGSTSIFNQAQFDELALGLELVGRPFLWVVRADSTTTSTGTSSTITFPDGFQDRVTHLGKIVGWAPQQKLLNHPSVACFMSHCGWNSTMDGVSMGVPFICWPYFADQFFNKSYITDVWKVGLGLDPDENGIVTRFEIKRKVEQLLGDEALRESAKNLKETAFKTISEGGSSFRNFDQFVKAMKK